MNPKKVKPIYLFIFKLATLWKFNSILLVLVVLLSGCLKKNRVEVTIKNSKSTNKLSATVTNVQILNNQIIISGSNLQSVSSFKINDSGTYTNLSIESNNGNQIIANVLSNITFSAGKVLDFVISNANASATFSVSFSLCDSILGGKGFSCSSIPNDKEVLSYDAISGKWKPRAINGLSYQGSWDASTSLPSTTSPGDYYIVSVANGIYKVGDWIVFNGSGFDRIDNSQSITSVFGRTGVIVATKGDYNLTKLADVDLLTTTPNPGDVLKFNGTKWIPGVDLTGSSGTVSQVNVTAPLAVTSATTTPNLSISQASTSTDGYLTSTDWNTFNSKQSAISAGTNSQYFRGDKSWQTLDTLAVAENTNLYFTNARVLGVSLSGLSITNSAVTDSDSILSSAGKFQGQINSINTNSSKFLIKNATDTVTGVVVIDATGDLQVSSPLTLNSVVNKSYVDNQVSGASNQWSASSGNLYRSTGNIGIGTSTPGEKLEVVGTVKATSFISTSDRRLKTDFIKVPGIETILNLNGYQFKWKNDERNEYGVIAQEVQRVLPFAVHQDEKSGFLAVSYNALVAPVIEAIKTIWFKVINQEKFSSELAYKVNRLEDENKQLKMENKQFADRLQKLEKIISDSFEKNKNVKK